MFKIQIEMTNDAFAEDPQGELLDILSMIKRKITEGSTGGIARDHNGNTVGEWSLDPRGLG